MVKYELDVKVLRGNTTIYINPPELTATIFDNAKQIMNSIISDINTTAMNAIRNMTPVGSAYTIELELKKDSSILYNPKVIHTITGASDDGIKTYLSYGISLMCEKAKTYIT